MIELAADFDQVFIMRFWIEPAFDDPEDSWHWRVRIRHVNSRRQFHTDQVENAFDIVRGILSGEDSAQGLVS